MVKRSRTKSELLKENRRGQEAIGQGPQMCPIHNDFKHIHVSEGKDFRPRSKVSSMM